MKERPLLFSAPMVRALLDGTKTQTRRMVKIPKPLLSCCKSPSRLHVPHNGDAAVFAHCYLRVDFCESCAAAGARLPCPHGQPGDRLWVKETFYPLRPGKAHYRAAGEILGYKWRPSIFMPRWASRLTLEITAIRVERLWNISDADAQAEGCEWTTEYNEGMTFSETDISPKKNYRHLWVEINGPGSWALNPWVWVLTFRKL